MLHKLRAAEVSLPLHRVSFFWLFWGEEACKLLPETFLPWCLSIRRSTQAVTVEMGSMHQRKIRHKSLNCVSSVVLQLLLPTLENTGIQSAFPWWRNLEKAQQGLGHNVLIVLEMKLLGCVSWFHSTLYFRLTCHNKWSHNPNGQRCSFVDEGFGQEVTQGQHKCPQCDVIKPAATSQTHHTRNSKHNQRTKWIHLTFCCGCQWHRHSGWLTRATSRCQMFALGGRWLKEGGKNE